MRYTKSATVSKQVRTVEVRTNAKQRLSSKPRSYARLNHRVGLQIVSVACYVPEVKSYLKVHATCGFIADDNL